MSNSLRPHGLQHARLLCPPLSPSKSLLKFMSIESVMLSNHLPLCCPLLFLPSIFLSIRIFSNESAVCIKWPKYWSFSFNVSPSNEYSGLISSRMLLIQFSSVQFSYSVMSYSLRPHESQHARPPCPSPTPGVHSDSRPSSQ